MKKICIRLTYTLIAFIFLWIFLPIQVNATNIFEYYFYPGETESVQEKGTDYIAEFYNALPNEVKEKIPDGIQAENNEISSDTITKTVDFSNLWNEIVSGISVGIYPVLKSTVVIVGILLIASLIKILNKNISINSSNDVMDFVLNMGIILSITGTEILSIDRITAFKDLICGIMNGMVPVFGIVYAASGNANTAVIQSGGVMLLVTLCQNLYAMVMLPTVRICLLFSIVGAVFPDVGIRPITSVFKNIANGIMLICVTLFSFVLGLQNTIAQSADSFGARSIKFAIGNMVPIIGGAVSDSLSTIGGSLSLLKSLGGTAAIVAIVILLVPTIAQFVMRRLSIYLCKSIAGVLRCTNEEKLLDDIGSVSSVVLAFVVSISIAFIYTLTLFANSSLALSG